MPMKEHLGLCDLLSTINDLMPNVRHTWMYEQEQGRPGLTDKEREAFIEALKDAEYALLETGLSLYKAVGIMLTASTRWLTTERAGDDPTKPPKDTH